MFGTCLGIGRAQDQWVLKEKDECNSKRPHWRKRSGPFMPQLTTKPSSLENNEEDLIIHEKKKEKGYTISILTLCTNFISHL